MQRNIFQNIPRIANTEPEYDRLQKLPKINASTSAAVTSMKAPSGISKKGAISFAVAF